MCVTNVFLHPLICVLIDCKLLFLTIEYMLNNKYS